MGNFWNVIGSDWLGLSVFVRTIQGPVGKRYNKMQVPKKIANRKKVSLIGLAVAPGSGSSKSVSRTATGDNFLVILGTKSG